jgi:hypothetical protein
MDLTSQDWSSMPDFSEKSILVKQINDSIEILKLKSH